jgi:Flp pilus assembly protein TadD
MKMPLGSVRKALRPIVFSAAAILLSAAPILLSAALLACAAGIANARDLRISIPKHSQSTPVQQLNREGVKAVQKGDIKKAEKLFYKAYLLDPDDPFTLNNLGYISELQGKVERAQEYYQLAGQENSEAVIADASSSNVKGRTFNELASAYGGLELGVNRGNVEAMSLLQQGRTNEAEAVLRKTLERDPNSPFTINNLGYVMEEEGNLELALVYYTKAAGLHSPESVVVAVDPHWRGKAISQVAASNAEAVRKRLANENSAEARAARLNLQGVYELNHNDPAKARIDFEQAFKLDPQNAFALNNRGYVAEMEGDQESANEYYSAAKQAEGAGQRAAATSHLEMKNMRLADVADNNDQITEANLAAKQEQRRRLGAPIELRRRDNTANTETNEAPAPEENTAAPKPLVPRPPVDNAPVDNGPVAPDVPRPPRN